MTDLGELYAACIIEYASSEPQGILAGEFSLFGKDVRDTFNLPYDKDLFIEAFQHLEQIGVLTKYQHKNVPTRYSVRVSAFKNAMIVEGNQTRRYEKFPTAPYSVTNASSHASAFGQRRSPTILESYADLGSDYLRDLLKAFEPELQTIGVEESEGDSDEVDDDDSLAIPAADRVVTLTHNQQVSLETKTQEIIEVVEKQNQIDGDASLRTRVIGQLKAGLELIRASIFDAQIMYLTLVETLKLLVARYDQAIIGSLAGSLLVELAKVNGLFN